jgi:hypothetical protein
MTLFAGESLNSSSLSAVPGNAAAPYMPTYGTDKIAVAITRLWSRSPFGEFSSRMAMPPSAALMTMY